MRTHLSVNTRQRCYAGRAQPERCCRRRGAVEEAQAQVQQATVGACERVWDHASVEKGREQLRLVLPRYVSIR
jgi:hypothetical protein